MERGVFRSLDGGKSWKKVLYKDENTGAIQVSIDPSKNLSVVYADLLASRLVPGENGRWYWKVACTKAPTAAKPGKN